MNINVITIKDVEVTFEPKNIKVFPEVDGNTNVIGKVIWAVKFAGGGQEIEGGGSTDLTVFNIKDFKPIDQLTKQDLINFIIQANGGENWVSRLKDIHFELLYNKVKDAAMVDHPLPQN